MRLKSKALRKRNYSGKKKRFTKSHQIITDDKGRILCVGKAQEGRKHDKRVYDEIKVVKPPGIKVLADLGYLGTRCHVPIKKPKGGTLTLKQKQLNRVHASKRVRVEHAICGMKNFRIFSGIYRNNKHQNVIAKNIAALANINLKAA